MRSRKLTNWLNTRLLVVASCKRRLLSSSTNASIFEDDRQLSRLRRPRIPCRIFVRFSSNSRAGASRSMVKAKWQTGQAGWKQHSFNIVNGKGPWTYVGFKGRFQILFDTFAIKDMPALGLNGVFCDIITKSTHSRFWCILNELRSIGLASKNKIRMAGHLSHPGKSFLKTH